MAQRPTVRWNECAKRWMAWVRFPDGTRKKVERVDKADAQRDLNDPAAGADAMSRSPSPQAANVQRDHRRVIRGWLPERDPDEGVATRPREVAEQVGQCPPAPRRQHRWSPLSSTISSRLPTWPGMWRRARRRATATKSDPHCRLNDGLLEAIYVRA